MIFAPAELEERTDVGNKPNTLSCFAVSNRIDQREAKDVQDQSGSQVVSVQIVKKGH